MCHVLCAFCTACSAGYCIAELRDRDHEHACFMTGSQAATEPVVALLISLAAAAHGFGEHAFCILLHSLVCASSHLAAVQCMVWHMQEVQNLKHSTTQSSHVQGAVSMVQVAKASIPACLGFLRTCMFCCFLCA